MPFYSEYKVKNGLSCTGQFRNMGQIYVEICIVFGKWTDIHMYMYVVTMNQSTPMVGGTQVGGEGGATSFQFSSRGNRKLLKQLRREQIFFPIYDSNFRSPPPPPPPGGSK